MPRTSILIRGDRVREFRENLGLTVRLLSEKLDVSVNSILKWEERSGSPISAKNLAALAATLGTTPEALRCDKRSRDVKHTGQDLRLNLAGRWFVKSRDLPLPGQAAGLLKQHSAEIEIVQQPDDASFYGEGHDRDGDPVTFNGKICEPYVSADYKILACRQQIAGVCLIRSLKNDGRSFEGHFVSPSTGHETETGTVVGILSLTFLGPSEKCAEKA